MAKLDVLVIGGGTAGGYAAHAAKRTADAVGMVEKGVVGGDCIFHACIPTKALVHAARMYKRMRTADSYGLPSVSGGVDYKSVKEFKDRIIAGIGTGRDRRFGEAGIQLFKGNAQFVSPHEVKIGDEVVEADRIIVATGSLPLVPPIPGLQDAGYITSIEALELERLPERLAIVGGGPVGLEFAQIFAAFGSTVHIYEALDRILIGEDDEISQTLARLISAQGISVSTSLAVSEVKRTGSAKVIVSRGADGQQQSAEHDEILVATGRKPAVGDLNLPAAGIRISKGGIAVDASLQTNLAHVWAAGDVTGTFAFTLIAWQQGEAAGNNATSDRRVELDYRVLPRVTFCDPEVAGVGLTEKQARQQGYRVKVGKYDFANLTRAIVSDETKGLVKIVAEEGSGRILGGHIVGVEASTLIHEVAVAMARGLTVADIGDTFHAYPTLSEGVRYACQGII